MGLKKKQTPKNAVKKTVSSLPANAETTTSTAIMKKVESVEAFFASPMYDFLTPFRPVGNQWCAKYVIVIFALIIRCAVGLGGYSGMNTPPMFGDFEAQRHWMEITQHLPVREWYWYDCLLYTSRCV